MGLYCGCHNTGGILCILLGSVVNSVLGNNKRNACLKNVFQFTSRYGFDKTCNKFTGKKVKAQFEGSPPCSQTCEVTIVGLQRKENYLGAIILWINGFNQNTTVCSRRDKNRVTLIINCSIWEKGDLMVGDSCVSDIQCAEGGHKTECKDEVRCLRNEQCDVKGNTESNKVCVDGSCVCKDGYVMIRNNCITGNLVLNKSCDFNEQCAGSPYATCLDGKCTCIKGYTANNSADCVLRIQEYSQPNSIITNKDVRNNNLGVILGALFGGLFLGVLVTTGVVFIFLRRFRSNTERGDTPQVRYVENNAHNAAYVDIHRDQETTNSTNVQRKVVNVSPYTRPVESPEYSNYSGNPRRQPAQEDVYNHLNEKEDRNDDGNYDHTSAAVGHLRDLNDYSNVDDMDKKIAAPDVYFTLKPN